MELKPEPDANILQHSLDELLSGEASLDTILTQHPDIVGVLRPQLEAALWLAKNQAWVDPRPGFVTASRHRLMSRIHAERSSTPTVARQNPKWFSRRLVIRFLLAVLLLAFLFTGNFLAVVVRESIPGDAFYPVKTFTEAVQLAFTLQPVSQARLRVEYARRRVAEVEALVLEGRFHLAVAAMHDFDRQIQSAIPLLEAIKQHDLVLAGELAGMLNGLVQDQTYLIGLLSVSAPASLKNELEQFNNTSLSEMTILQDMLFDTGGTATGTPTITTSQVTKTPTLALLSSPTSMVGKVAATGTGTPTLTLTPRPTNTHRPTEFVKMTSTPTFTPSSTSKATHTPRPTNTHRPPKTDSPKPTAKPTRTNKP